MKELKGRPLEVLTDAANGMVEKQIAEHLGIKQRTVEEHMRTARAAMKARTTAQAIAKAIARGIIKISEISLVALLCIGSLSTDALRTRRTQPRPPVVRVKNQESSN